MLTTAQLRQIEPSLQELSEEEVLALRDAFYEAAQLAFEVRWVETGGSKNPVRSLTAEEEGSTL